MWQLAETLETSGWNSIIVQMKAIRQHVLLVLLVIPFIVYEIKDKKF